MESHEKNLESDKSYSPEVNILRLLSTFADS